MKMKRMSLSGQVLIVLLTAIVLGFMLQIAQAQTPQSQVMQINVPQKSLSRSLLEKTSLNYYTQFLGPTVAGTGGQSYNVFQEGRTPYQNFHAMNIRYQHSPDWAIGASIAAVNMYGDTVISQQGQVNTQPHRDEFFNARAFMQVPSLKTWAGTLNTTIAYEAPTSVVSKNNGMQYGGVLTQSFALPIESLKLTAGLSWQYWRAVYKDNISYFPENYFFPGSVRQEANRYQTTIFSGGPYLGYRFNDRWGMMTSMTFDWDQRGNQASKNQWNNNLPDRWRMGMSYYPTTYRWIQNVGIFSQSLVKYTSSTQAVGAELALSF